MPDSHMLSIVDAAERLYETRLKSELEPLHRGEFVAIEPSSGEYFLGRTMSEAKQAARSAYPDRLTYLMRVGVTPAIHIGVWP